MSAAARPAHDRRGFVRGVVYLALIAICIWAAYLVSRGDAGTMADAFIRRVRAMGQPQ